MSFSYPESTTYMEGEAEISICALHSLELCHECCMDFTDMNMRVRKDAKFAEMERDASGARGSFQPRSIPTTLGKPLVELAPGTRVRMLDRSGRVPPQHEMCTIVATNMFGTEYADQELHGNLPCYIVKMDKDGERFSYPCEDLHDEWAILDQ